MERLYRWDSDPQDLIDQQEDGRNYLIEMLGKKLGHEPTEEEIEEEEFKASRY